MKLPESLLIVLGMITVFTSITAASGFTPSQKEHDRDQEQRLANALTNLSSVDDSERTAAKETLLSLGQTAIPPLVDLLRSLIPKVEVCPPGSNLPCSMSFLLESDARRTKREDVISLLGQLRAKSAVPLLINLMGLQQSIMGDGFRYWGPETSALIEIGGQGVPELLDSLSLAAKRRQSAPLINGIGLPYLQIELRIVDVLGKIGDPRALPLLVELKENAKPFLATCLEESIERIMERSRK